MTRGAQTIAFRADLDESGGGLWACLRSERRRRFVTDDDPVGANTVTRFRVAGTFVGWIEFSPQSCRFGCPVATQPMDVGIFDVSDGRNRLTYGERDIAAFVLARDGIAVWTGRDRNGVRVVRYAGLRARGTLDRGEIDPLSLRVSGRTATWTVAGGARSAQLPAR